MKYNNVKIVITKLKLTVNRNLNSLVEITTAQKKKKKATTFIHNFDFY